MTPIADKTLAEKLEASGPVVIAGAGQAGALLAIYLARAGVDVTMYESLSLIHI